MTGGVRIKASALCFSFDPGEATSSVFTDFYCDFSVPRHALAVIQGVNGIGKSVLARLIAGLDLPDSGSVVVSDRDKHRTTADARVLYIPQHIEHAHDRLAIDMFKSLAGAGSSLLDVFALRNALLRAGVGRARYQRCSKIDPAALISGILASVAFSNIDLLILDEPFAHLSNAQRIALSDTLKSFLREASLPVIVIAHPEQAPTTPHLVLTLEKGVDGRKALASSTQNACLPDHSSLRSHDFCGRPAFCVYWHDKKARARAGQPVYPQHVNTVFAPGGLSSGRFAAMIMKSITSSRRIRWSRWTVRAEGITQAFNTGNLQIRLLPSRAQTAVVMSNAPLADSAMFDRWEMMPVQRFPPFLVTPLLDRQCLAQKWFAEASEFLPLQHENPQMPGSGLSGGNRQLLALRTILYPLPHIVLLASPFAGLDELNSQRVSHYLEYAALNGVTIVNVQAGGRAAHDHDLV